MRSAIFSSRLERSVVLVLPHASFAACAASSASSMSSALERGIDVMTLPVIGEAFSKYWPDFGSTHLPPM